MSFRGLGWLEIMVIALAVLVPAAVVIALVLITTRRPAAGYAAGAAGENNSGRGSGTQVPFEIRGWNWGGFFLTWIWGIGNSVWIALIALIPGAHLIMAVILGALGNQWAWQSRRWESIQHFRDTQRTWAWAGLALFLLPVLALLLTVFFFRAVY